MANPILAVALLAFVAILIYREPKFFLSVFLIGAFILAVLFLISYISDVGVAQKETLINKSR
ncbi:MAG TPA: hypothetical protein ENH04_03165 [Nitrospirae bacterium]|nr:hypothetical protein [Nitrospirota bacterium]